MKKSALLMAIGEKPAADEDEDIDTSAEAEDEDEADSDEDEAIETFLDDTLDIEARKAAFRAAVKACAKGY